MKFIHAIIVCLFIAAAATPAKAEEFNSAESFIKRVRGEQGTGGPGLTDKDLTYIYTLGDGIGFLCDSSEMPLNAEKKLHDLINDKKLGAKQRAAKVHERIGADITEEDHAYLESIGYDRDPPDSGDAVIARAHVHYFIHNPDLTPAQREAKIHDAYYQNQTFIDQQQQDAEAQKAFQEAIDKRDAQTSTDQWLEAFDRDPAYVGLFLLVFAAICLSPVWPAVLVIRGIHNRTLTRASRKIPAVALMVFAVACALQFFPGGNKAEYVWILPTPVLMAAAAALWLDRVEKRHRIALGCLAGACLLSAADYATGHGPLSFVGGFGLIGCTVGASYAAAMPPYAAQGRADILCRVIVLVACLGCLGFWALMSILQTVARVTM